MSKGINVECRVQNAEYKMQNVVVNCGQKQQLATSNQQPATSKSKIENKNKIKQEE